MIFRVQRYFIYYLNKLSQNEGTSWVKLSNFFFLINCSTVNYKLTFFSIHAGWIIYELFPIRKLEAAN